jgi:DNA-binding transcriptional ArsR family regulator
MPIMERTLERPTMKVLPSAPLELMWVLHNCQSKHLLEGSYASMEPVRQRFAEDLKSLWDDGVRGFTEVMVLAQWGDTVLDTSLDRFFDTLEAVAVAGGAPATLLSETPSERRAFAARLQRLRTEPELRARYRSLLMSVWEPLKSEWEITGCPASAIAAEDWRRRLEAGEGYRDLVERQRLWPGRPEIDELAESALAEGRLILSPGWFFGEIHVVELEGVVYVGRGIRSEDHDALRRATSTRVAGNLKALADPTRLNILLWLARKPSSVTEVARGFELSQPTVSAHVQILREVGLIDEKPNGRSSRLTVSRARLKNLFGDAEESLLHLFPRSEA